MTPTTKTRRTLRSLGVWPEKIEDLYTCYIGIDLAAPDQPDYFVGVVVRCERRGPPKILETWRALMLEDALKNSMEKIYKDRFLTEEEGRKNQRRRIEEMNQLSMGCKVAVPYCYLCDGACKKLEVNKELLEGTTLVPEVFKVDEVVQLGCGHITPHPTATCEHCGSRAGYECKRMQSCPSCGRPPKKDP